MGKDEGKIVSIAQMIREGLFDGEVIERATELLKSGDMDYDFLCDDCEDKFDIEDYEPMVDESRE